MPSFSPTPEQSAIVDFIRDNPTRSLMVDARAGSAKTSTIELAAQAIPPKLTTLAVAFNKRIAEELALRLPPHVVCKTLNALGHAAWSTAISRRLQVDMDKMFKLAKEVVPGSQERTKFGNSGDDTTFADVLALARGAKSVGLVPKGAPMARVGLVPDTDESWSDIAFTRSIDATAEVVAFARQLVLRSIKSAYDGLIDFDDQIYMSVLFGGTYARYHTTIVDESQDLSPLNHRQLRLMFGTRLIAVGDPYQAIYGFRGAHGRSMDAMSEMFNFERLGLTYSFRVPHEVSSRQTAWVPDFKSWQTVPQGEVQRWPSQDPTQPADSRLNQAWSIGELPRSHAAVICRNNAPLMRLAFALIKARRPVKILGRDIGASLAALLHRIGSKRDARPLSELPRLIEAWHREEAEKVRDSETKLDTLHDRKECLEVLVEASGCATLGEAVQFIRDLFADKSGTELLLSSGHRSKGLEWPWVMHLDPWRVPSKFAQRAEEAGNPIPMQQERNLRYVIETRTKGTLVLASLADCEDIGTEGEG